MICNRFVICGGGRVTTGVSNVYSYDHLLALAATTPSYITRSTYIVSTMALYGERERERERERLFYC